MVSALLLNNAGYLTEISRLGGEIPLQSPKLTASGALGVPEAVVGNHWLEECILHFIHVAYKTKLILKSK